MVPKNNRQALQHFSKREKVLGQFFTPGEVANFILDFILLHRSEKAKAIDPACGEGIFLKGLIDRNFEEIVGVDVDRNVAASILPEVKSKVQIINADGLLYKGENQFDIIVSNPPFSAKYGRVKNRDILSRFELGRGARSRAVEILFVEKFVHLASRNGIIGVVLPSGIISNHNLKTVRKYLLQRTKILGVISLPRFIFNGMVSTSSKTCVLFLQKKEITKPYKVFMSVVTRLEQLKDVIGLFAQRKEKGGVAFWTEIEGDILAPQFYNPTYKKVEKELINSPFEVKKMP